MSTPSPLPEIRPGDIVVTGNSLLFPDGSAARCAIGRGGIVSTKREGDGGTPVGRWVLRRLVFRPDREEAPETELKTAPIAEDDGWCDDPNDPNYNRPVKLPYSASHENMWREDGLYDIVVILGHNDDPPIPGEGSAIFLHCARPDYGPTEGCVALAHTDLRRLLTQCGPETALVVNPPENIRDGT